MVTTIAEASETDPTIADERAKHVSRRKAGQHGLAVQIDRFISACQLDVRQDTVFASGLGDALAFENSRKSRFHLLSEIENKLVERLAVQFPREVEPDGAILDKLVTAWEAVEGDPKLDEFLAGLRGEDGRQDLLAQPFDESNAAGLAPCSQWACTIARPSCP